MGFFWSWAGHLTGPTYCPTSVQPHPLAILSIHRFLPFGVPVTYKMPIAAPELQVVAAQNKFLREMAPFFNATKKTRDHKEFLDAFYSLWWDRFPLRLADFSGDHDEMEWTRGIRNQYNARDLLWAAAASKELAPAPWREYVNIEADRKRRSTVPRPKPRPLNRAKEIIDVDAIPDASTSGDHEIIDVDALPDADFSIIDVDALPDANVTIIDVDALPDADVTIIDVDALPEVTTLPEPISSLKPDSQPVNIPVNVGITAHEVPEVDTPLEPITDNRSFPYAPTTAIPDDDDELPELVSPEVLGLGAAFYTPPPRLPDYGVSDRLKIGSVQINFDLATLSDRYNISVSLTLSLSRTMARTSKKFKLINHHRPSTKSPTKRVAQHTSYSSKDGAGSTVATRFLTIKPSIPTQPTPGGDDLTATTDVRGTDAGINIAYDSAYLEHLEENGEEAPKRKRHASDDPLKMWLPFRDQYLQELICVDGRGPQFWNGSYFEKKSLKSMGLRFQLGHIQGERCANPQSCTYDDFTIIDNKGIHTVGIDFCACGASNQSHVVQLLRARLFPATVSAPRSAASFQVLKTFEILSYESKVSVFEFYSSLARLTDNTGLSTPKDRYPSFLIMIREWRYLKMLKRAARGHEINGIETTTPGSCAVECPACPQPDKNMPNGWQDAPDDKKWLHSLFVGIDANFRMKRKDVSNDDLDPDLGKGFAYFVEEKTYKAHLENHRNEVEPKSTCLRHDAVNLANSKPSQGHAATGVGTIECIRHDMKRPLSVGDLQVGERYCNMDYLFYQSIRRSSLTHFIVSYDIACQWSINLRQRMFDLDHEFLIFNKEVNVRFFVPKFHLPAHVVSCRTSFSFNYGLGVARTDGEAPERGWADIDPLSASTKEMGPGSRRDTLDSHFGDYNWRKVIAMGRTLLRRFNKASTDIVDHVTAHRELSASIPPELLVIWTAQVKAWEKNQSEMNPFISEVIIMPTNALPAPTQAAVRRELAESEAQHAGQSSEISFDDYVSPSVLIASGLNLEGEQYVIRSIVQESILISARRSLNSEAAKIWEHSQDRQHTKLQLRSNTLQRKIASWTRIQQMYIPGVVALRQAEEHALAAQKKSSKPYTMCLWLPSHIGGKISFDLSLARIEWKLRIAQAYEALDTVRSNLQIRSHLFKFKDRFVRGQHANTRARGALDTVQARISTAADEYRAAYSALTSLSTLLGDYSWQQSLLPLDASDLRELSEAENESVSEGRRKISWIWKTLGVIGDDNSDTLRDGQ
ncbi:hypothetical protein H0H93_015447 [Arthromyces matolae]|nr:hypothetical protein H0H93_015447 [Arthromyces matolae]